MKILFENQHCIAVDKPAGWLAVPGRTADDARPILGHQLQEKLNARIFPIHRLDAEVSGLILYGKTPDFHKAANALFEEKQVQKTYQAFTQPANFQVGQKLTWKSKLLRGKKRAYEAEFGKISVTEAEVISQNQERAEWRLKPVTGRSHQLRFEMYKHQCPILGDALYGSLQSWPEGIALKAIELKFPVEFSLKWDLPEALRADVMS